MDRSGKVNWLDRYEWDAIAGFAAAAVSSYFIFATLLNPTFSPQSRWCWRRCSYCGTCVPKCGRSALLWHVSDGQIDVADHADRGRPRAAAAAVHVTSSRHCGKSRAALAAGR